MLVEEAEDALPGVLGGRLVVVETGYLFNDGERAAVVPVQKRVPRAGVLLHVVWHLELGEGLLQPSRGAAEHEVALAVTGHDGADAAQSLGRVRRYHPIV